MKTLLPWLINVLKESIVTRASRDAKYGDGCIMCIAFWPLIFLIVLLIVLLLPICFAFWVIETVVDLLIALALKLFEKWENRHNNSGWDIEMQKIAEEEEQDKKRIQQ
jgi:hypothetical protein